MRQIHWHELERRKKTGASMTVKVQFLVQFFQKMAAYAAIVIAIMVACPGGRGQSPSYYRDVAFEREPGMQVEYSSFLFRSKKSEEQIPCPVNRGADAADALGPCHWRSNEFQHMPQWVWVHFAGSRRIDKVVLHAASAATMPVEFSGQYRERGATFHTIIHVQDAHFDPQTLTYTIQFTPVVTDNFRLLIERNTAKETPLSWRAELAQMEVFGTDAAEGTPAAATEAPEAERASVPHAALASTGFVPKVEEVSGGIAISTPWYRLVLDKERPRIVSLALDSLGKGELGVNLLQESGAYPVLDRPFESAAPVATGALTRDGNVFRYAPVKVAPGVFEQVEIRAGAQGFDLSLAAVAKHAVLMRGGLFRFDFAANQTPTTFVCHPSKLMNYVDVPTYLAAPDFGTVYITRTGDAAAFYRRPSSLFPATSYAVDVTPHLPASEDGLNEIGPQPWHTTLHFEVKTVQPLPPLLKRDARLARFPKYSLDMVQWRPDTGMVSNSVMSINCGLAMLFYAEQAVWGPRLEDGISPMELVGASVDQYFKGARGYMMPNVNVESPDWKSQSRETPAFLLVSGWYVIRTIGGLPQAQKWLKPMEAVTDRIESHFDRDGLVDEPGKEWFDVYDFQGPDAFSNAADYRAFLCMADVEALVGRQDLAKRYRADAERIKAVYFKTFFNPETGVLAGWKSPDGELHDYMFPWVNGFAIYQGLVPAERSKAILQTMLAKMQSIGFESYQYGLPTNLIPMSPADYFPRTSGAPKQADGKDTWQVYMNGGATPPYEYYFIQALYQDGLVDDAERLLWPLMQSYEKGTFNAGIELPEQKQRNAVGSAFFVWDGSRGRGEGYLPEDWQGVGALFTGHFGIGFDERGYFFEPWSPLKEQKIRLEMPYMGKTVPRFIRFRSGEN
jgi:Bacterial alpha-L-rhamnosidase 6 hairpin glycosidase domain